VKGEIFYEKSFFGIVGILLCFRGYASGYGDRQRGGRSGTGYAQLDYEYVPDYYNPCSVLFYAFPSAAEKGKGASRYAFRAQGWE